MHLSDPAALRAAVMSLQADYYAVSFKNCLKFIGDLLSDTFLHGKSPGIFAHNASELGQPDDLFVAQAANIGLTDEGQRMMFAQRGERYRSFDDLHRGAILLAIDAFALKDNIDLGIPVVSLGHIYKCLDPSIWSPFACVALKVHTHSPEYFCDMLLKSLALCSRKRLSAGIGYERICHLVLLLVAVCGLRGKDLLTRYQYYIHYMCMVCMKKRVRSL